MPQFLNAGYPLYVTRLQQMLEESIKASLSVCSKLNRSNRPILAPGTQKHYSGELGTQNRLVSVALSQVLESAALKETDGGVSIRAQSNL